MPQISPKPHKSSQKCPQIVVRSNNGYSSNSNIIRDKEGFFTYISQSKRKKLTVGTWKDSNTQLKSAEKNRRCIYIGMCDTNITADSIVKYVKNEIIINVIDCVQLDVKIKFFKLFK